MFTACPNCKLHLAVTASDLRVGQGYVRCGRCDRVFNALLSLGEDGERDAQSGHSATGTTTVPALEYTDDAILTGLDLPPEPVSTEPLPDQAIAPGATPSGFVADGDGGPENTEDAATQQVGSDQLLYVELADPVAGLPEIPGPSGPAPEDFVAPDEWSKVSAIRPQLSEDVEVEETMATGTFETIVLEGDTILQTEEHVDETEVDAQIQQIADQMVGEMRVEPAAAERYEGGVDVEEHPAEEVVLEAEAEAEAQRESGSAPEIDADAAVGNAPRLHWAWSAGAAALLLALVGQVVHHHRQSLVASPWAEKPLRAVYGLFGHPLEPRWDLKAYDLRQLGGEALPGDAEKIVLRATVQNRSTSRQPPPMIRVTLQDRFGNALSTTAIAPQDYLKGSTPSRIDTDQRLDALLTLDDPNRQAVGFELDACLPDAAGRLHCSNDP